MADKIRISHKYDLEGNYEASDSENEYSPSEKKLLDDFRKRKHKDDSGSEEELYAFSDSDDDSDNKKDDLGIADSDVEGQEKSDDDLPDRKAWGKRKKSYYATDYVDQDYGGLDDDEEAALMEEEEVKNIQKGLLEQLADHDHNYLFVKASSEKDSSQITKSQKIKLLEKESPELAGLVDDFKTKLTVAKEDLHPLLELVKDGKLPNCSASKFIKTNYDLILNYCTNISFYLLLKSQGISIQNHPVIKRLSQYRQMLQKMEPIYLEIIKPQIDKILHAVSNNLELHITELGKRQTKKRKLDKVSSEAAFKRLKLKDVMEKDDGDDTGVSDDDDEYEDYKTKDSTLENISRPNEESEESGFSDSDGPDELASNEDKPSTSQDVFNEDVGDKREITYQIAKNKGLTPHRKKEQRNPRVKHKLKYRKAKIRRKGAIRDVRTEITRYAGEASGIKANVKKGIKIK